MDNELSQLDALIESDVLDALGEEPKEDINNSENNVDELLIEDHHGDEDITNSTNDIENISQDDSLIEANSIQNNATTQEASQPSLSLAQDMTSASLSKLLSELLNNKTIEITIKVKE